MNREVFVKRSRIPAPADLVYRWHIERGAFERVTPPWERIEILRWPEQFVTGSSAQFRFHLGPTRPNWIAEFKDVEPGRSFCDVQTAGPFAYWRHTHTFDPDGANACWLDDRVEYALPLGAAGQLVAGSMAHQRLKRMFDYRHRVISDELAALRRFRTAPALGVLVTGSTGLVGTGLVAMLSAFGHRCRRLLRPSRGTATGSAKDAATWDPATGDIDPKAWNSIDAVVHLAGESISRRWTQGQKSRIHESRSKGTRQLCEAMARLESRPRTFICASAIGFYGDRGDEELDEQSSLGKGFLADVCRDWEAATQPASEAGIRVVNLRFGVILSPKGGALAKLLTPFKMGAGGRVGHGRQFMSWIAHDDALGAAHHALMDESLSGPVNVVAPNPVTNAEFSRVLGKVLHRPAVMPLPAAAVRLMFGEMGDELLLAGQRVQPARLTASGYPFRFATLEGALRHLLGAI